MCIRFRRDIARPARRRFGSLALLSFVFDPFLVVGCPGEGHDPFGLGDQRGVYHLVVDTEHPSVLAFGRLARV